MVTLLALIALGLAAYRGTQLVVHDSIAEPIRDRIHAWHNRNPTRARTALITLITCTYCTGWWVSGITLAAYLTATTGWNTGGRLLLHGIEWFTVAGIQALANRWDDTRIAS